MLCSHYQTLALTSYDQKANQIDSRLIEVKARAVEVTAVREANEFNLPSCEYGRICLIYVAL